MHARIFAGWRRHPPRPRLGVGLMIPSLTGAVAATLAPAQLETGIAVQTTGRQIGSALGFAILVAMLGTPHTAGDFRVAWGADDPRQPARRATFVAIDGRAPRAGARAHEHKRGSAAAGSLNLSFN
jgi:hypothetical protein